MLSTLNRISNFQDFENLNLRKIHGLNRNLPEIYVIYVKFT